jgi:bifunctional DNA-binding transcriptional regulator/antitoxin component of YhaV-PrlF toxin-antitoxin module
MVRTNISSKGQITIPQVFRQRMPLTGKQEVEVDQLPDGSVVVRPVASILSLAGSIALKRSLLPPREERRQARKGMAEQAAKRGRSA